MADVIVLHHAMGLTAGVQAFADRLAAAGHRVMVPDLYEGEAFGNVDDGVAHAEAIGFDTVIDRGVAAAAALDDPFVTIGFSLGVLPAQNLAQTHRRAAGAVLCHAAIPLGTFADTWPDGVPLHLHNARGDGWGDFDEAAALAAAVPGAVLFEYDTTRHLVADSSTDDYDAEIAEQIIDRTLALLATVA
jgi:dienelactone hydrolase